VLLNGRRFVPGGFGANATVDINSIPSAIIERIEVLKDGASAVYGSDAIAGVVNLITRKNYQGTELAAYVGGTTRSDGGTYDLSLTTGFTADAGSAIFSAGFSKNDPVWAGNRDFSTYQLAFDFNSGQETKSGSSRVPAGRVYGLARGRPDGNLYYNNLINSNPASRTAFIFNNGPTAPDYIAGGPNGVGGAVVCNAAGDIPGVAAGTFCARPFRGGISGVDLPVSGGDGYNFNKANLLYAPLQRIQLWSSGDARLGSVARGYYEASYVNRRSDQKLAPEPLIIGVDGEADISISKYNQYNPFGRSFNQGTLSAAGADLSLCPDPTDLSTCNFGRVSRRLEEFSNRHTSQDLDTFRVVGGIDGTLSDWAGPLKGLFWDAFANYGRTQGTNTNTGNLNKTLLQNALGPSQGGTCYSAYDPATQTYSGAIAGCVPLNLFGGPGTITQDQVAYLSYEGNLRGYSEMFMVGAQASTELFKLMSDRPASLAVGYENRHERGSNVPDSLAAAGLASGGANAPTKGGFRVNEGFAELSIPILSQQVGAEELEATLAGRYVDYDTFGSKFTYKVGARWTPIRDVTLRGTYSTAFRAPSISELYAGQADSFESGEDPCAINPNLPACPHAGTATGGTGGQVKASVGGNPNLKAESAKIFTAGLVLQPTMVKGLSVTVDYYNLKVDDSIVTLGAFAIMSGCHNAVQSDPAMCALISRDAQGEILRLTDLNLNGGTDTVQGIDFSVRYGLPTPYGKFGVGFDGAYVLKWDRQLNKAWTVPVVGTYDLAILNGSAAFGGGQPKFKGVAGVNWGFQGFGAGLNMRYVGNFKECAREDGGADGANGGGLCTPFPGTYTPGSRNVGQYVTFDGLVSYETSSSFGKSSVALGMRNIADKAPPIIYSGFTMNSDPGLYDYMGRFVYVRLSQRF